MTNITKEKSELRRRFREERLLRFSQYLAERRVAPDYLYLLQVPEIRDAKVVTSYLSIKDEPSTATLNLALIAAGKNLLLPRVVHPNLEWVSWSGDRKKLSENRGLLEPFGESITDLSIIDAVIVPALRVDYQGYRMGQGGGYYDRSLPLVASWKVGIIYAEEFTVIPLPREDHDAALSAVATPTEVIRFR